MKEKIQQPETKENSLERAYSGYHIKKIIQALRKSRYWENTLEGVRKIKPKLSPNMAAAVTAALITFADGDFDKGKKGTAKNPAEGSKKTTLHLKDLPEKAIEIARHLVPEFKFKTAEAQEGHLWVAPLKGGWARVQKRDPETNSIGNAGGLTGTAKVVAFIDRNFYEIVECPENPEFVGGIILKDAVEEVEEEKSGIDWEGIENFYHEAYVSEVTPETGEALLTEKDFNRLFLLLKEEIGRAISEGGTLERIENGDFYFTNDEGEFAYGVERLFRTIIKKEATRIAKEVVGKVGINKVEVKIPKNQDEMKTLPNFDVVVSIPINFSDSRIIKSEVLSLINLSLTKSVSSPRSASKERKVINEKAFSYDEKLPFPFESFSADRLSEEGVSEKFSMKDNGIEGALFGARLSSKFMNTLRDQDKIPYSCKIGIKVGKYEIPFEIDISYK